MVYEDLCALKAFRVQTSKRIQKGVSTMRDMMKVLLVPVVAFAFAGSVWAQGTTPGAPAKPSTTTKPTEKKEVVVKVSHARGELVAVDSKAGTAKVKAKDGEMSVVADTKATRDALAKVKVGDNVQVAYVEKDGKLTLRSVRKAKVSTASKATPTKSPEKKEETKPAK